MPKPFDSWAVAADKKTDLWLALPDEDLKAYDSLKPGNALLLTNEMGRKAWGVRSVYLVRHEEGVSTIYFDRHANFLDEVDLPGGTPELHKIDSSIVAAELAAQFNGLTFEKMAEIDPKKESHQKYVRDLLELAVKDDLLGPAGGPVEEVFGNVHDRYLVGRLGPRRDADDDSSDQADDEESTAASAGDGRKMETVGDSDAASPAEEESEEDVADAVDLTKISMLLPSSMGLTVCVRADALSLHVKASWGRYVRTPSEFVVNPKTGRMKRCWKRHPAGGEVDIAIREGVINQVQVDEGVEQVVIQGHVSRPLGENKDLRLVTLFLVNLQRKPPKNADAAWVFQPELKVSAPDGSAIFRKRPIKDIAQDKELESLETIYRNRVEFAVGHNVSVHAEPEESDPEICRDVKTVVLPSYEVMATETPGKNYDMDREVLCQIDKNCLLDMRKIAAEIETASEDEIEKGVLGLLVTDYADWITGREAFVPDLKKEFHRQAALRNLAACKEVQKRLREGLDVLKKNVTARKAFAFANRVMADQRDHSAMAKAKIADPKLKWGIDHYENDPRNHSWRAFQLAFILLSIPSLADPSHKDRTDSCGAIADLLWFPTGGGKTEAYLGVAAFAMGIRRLQGELGGLDASRGLTVIMRYTLRLLTIQQFQRAAALICAMEVVRRADAATWGAEPFSLGLWVGNKTTPGDTEESAEAITAACNGSQTRAASPLQLLTCPWCGSPITIQHDMKADTTAGRTITFCSGELDRHCPFTQAASNGKTGVPIIVVDEELYHHPPTMMIATVDKFAMMAWKGDARALFGYAEKECPRHGLVLPDNPCSSHVKKGPYPTVSVKPIKRIRPPDLIIQDEFHLISGPLGTMVGLYETAVDELCSWEYQNKMSHPKVIASTATVRMAGEQIKNVFLRECSVFPPSGVDVEDNFFSVQRTLDEKFGRRYMGVCALGMSRPAALIRVYVAFLTAAQSLFDRFGPLADPYMTSVGYFNSLKELGGMRRLCEDDVKLRSFRVLFDKSMARPGLAQRNMMSLLELTSRVSSEEIPKYLKMLDVTFKKSYQKGETRGVDVVLATNMLSVGVDVDRLGQMIVNGQPKNTAEYIQATSRVGRRYPGLVCTVFAWSRPRDFSHYETFEHYHATFYKHVEAQSVTPFSARAMDRGLTGAMTSMMRLKDPQLAANAGADNLKVANHATAMAAKSAMAKRAENVKSMDAGALAGQMTQTRIDKWVHEVSIGHGRVVAYEKRGTGSGNLYPLLKKPGIESWTEFTAPTSMREVEGSVRLLMDQRQNLDAIDVEHPWTPRKDEKSGGEE